jgi:predicted dehydrogenase
MQRLGFGIIGCGEIAPTHVKAITGLAEAKLVAVCDVVEERAKKLADDSECNYYLDYREMLQRADLQVVNVTTASGMHAVIGIEVARAGTNMNSPTNWR